MLQELVGRNIVCLRGQQNCTREQLALRIDLDTAHLGSIERGEQNAMLRTLQRIARGLSVPPFELFREEDPDHPFDIVRRYVMNRLTVHIDLLAIYDPILLLGLFDSELMYKVTIQDVEAGSRE